MKSPGSGASALERLEARVGRGWKLGLERMRAALDALGRPEYPVILVGGTNGKGSVAAMIHQALFDDGWRVGLTTSPHLCDVRERFVVNGEEISAAAFERVFEAVEKIEEGTATYFETLAIMAIRYFQESKVDVAVVEIGLGGRLDAFNVLDPAVSVITSVGRDHEEQLGGTLEKIAIEKAQIAREGRPCILGSDLPALRAEVECLGAKAIIAPRPTDALYRELDLEIAVEAVRAFYASPVVTASGRAFDEDRCRASCAAAYWPGRFEIFPGDPAVILDAAHNPDAAAELARCLRRYRGASRIVGVVAFLKDKDAAGFFVRLDDVVDEWFVTEVVSERARPAIDVPAPYNAIVVPDPIAALERARAAAGPGGLVVVTGSIYLLGEILSKTELGEW